MGDAGATMKGWLLALLAAVTLFLGGLVLSYMLWNRIEAGSPLPCSKGFELRIEAAHDRLTGAASLLAPGGDDIRLTPRHVFHFPLDYMCIIPPGTGASALRDQLGVDWPCADIWAAQVCADDTFISVLAVSGVEITALRLRRADFDLAGEITKRIAPESEMILNKRPGSEQVLLRTP